MQYFKKIILIIVIICISIMLFGCSPSNIGLVGSKEKSNNDQGNNMPVDSELVLEGWDSQVKDHPDVSDTIKNTNDRDNSAGYSPPMGSFVLGEYSSPNKINSITLWGWHDKNTNDLQIDYIFWDWDKKRNVKLLTLLKGNIRDNNAPVVWLDDSRVLVEGVNLYNGVTQELKELLPDEVQLVIAYEINIDKTQVAMIGDCDDYMGVWVIDLGTEYIQEIYFFEKDYVGDLGGFKVAWAADNSFYFDSVDAGTAIIYQFKIDEYELMPVYEEAKLIDVDRKTGDVKYLHLDSRKSKEKEIAGSDIEKTISEIATQYLHDIGFKVGDDPGKITLIVDNIFRDKAVVLYGFWSSEFSGEIVLKKVDANWQVDFERQRYYLPYQKRFTEAMEFLSVREGFKYGEEEGKSIIGSPYWNEQSIVFLVGDYGEPWQWEYHISMTNNTFNIDNKIQLKGDMAEWWASESPTKTTQDFLESILKNDYTTAYQYVYSENNSLNFDQFKSEVDTVQSKVKAVDFDLGENRIQQQERKASVQVWLIGEIINQNEIFYGRVNLVEVQGNWKISWPLNIFGI